MSILFLLIGCSILIALVFLLAFFWAMRTGQNDDMQTPAMRILFDDDKPVLEKNELAEEPQEFI
jgi:cbb3-type cytochrome oxidase maturation protein